VVPNQASTVGPNQLVILNTRYAAEINRRTREEHYAADVGSLRPAEATGRRRQRLGLVDLDTGEINDL